jgi:aspartyl-tRNA(Asn)/glutamyl-tRNA(Gln) amidotransferase subunit A
VSSTAVAIAEAVRGGRISAREVVERALDAAETSQEALNAFTFIDRLGAMRRAADIDRRVAAGDDPGPLAGVPIGLKDLIDQAGLPNTAGSAFPAEVPERDAPVVSRLHEAGAVIVGRTGLHEFAFGFTSENAHFGPVRNPWDRSLSPGGSSGGSGAAVAAGITPIAVGTDTGGSVRVPAALCGVMGLKVTAGRVPLDGVVPLAPSLDTIGPLARSAADLETAYRVMADDPEPAPPLRRRLAVVRQWALSPLSSEVATGFEAAVARLAASGVAVEEIDVPVLEVPASIAQASLAEIATVHHERWRSDPDRYGPDVAARLQSAFAAEPATMEAARRWAGDANEALQPVFAEFDAVACPTVGATRKVIAEDDIVIGGRRYQHRVLLASWTFPINRLGLPAIALPLPSPTGPPPSLQLVGPQHGETLLLRLGALLEAIGVAVVAAPPIWFE